MASYYIRLSHELRESVDDLLWHLIDGHKGNYQKHLALALYNPAVREAIEEQMSWQEDQEGGK